jgi:hypothetical protein
MFSFPTIQGVIDRRILVNYRVDPAVIARELPAPFRPQVVHGFALAGICLIRLSQVRPRLAPRWLGLSSENAAQRIAVEWEEAGEVRQGVFVRRRDTDSRLNSLVGGRVFPGIHHHATFDVQETSDHFEIAMQSDDGATWLEINADLTDRWPVGSLFDSLTEASDFFAAGSLGYSTTSDPHRFQGLTLACEHWHVDSLAVRSVRSSMCDDPGGFPRGSATLDCALLMRGIQHEWHSREDLCCAEAVVCTGG